MIPERVNYDRIAPSYNRRFGGERPDGIRTALVDLANSIGARTILEAGCGTAHWLAALRSDLAHTACFCGLDLSSGMLAQARAEAPDLIQAAAEHIPIESRTFDLVYCVNAIHHFSDPSAFVRSARRVLRPGGTLAVVGSDPRHRQAKWYVYEYFPGTYPRDISRFPTWEVVEGWMHESGFAGCDLKMVEQIHDPKIGADVLSDPYLEKNATSQLALLSEAEYARGIERIQNALAVSARANQELVFHSDIYLYMLKASAPY